MQQLCRSARCTVSGPTGCAFGVTMRRLLLAATALTVCGPALAAPPAPANFSWTGCYVGGNVVPGWGDATFSGSTTIATKASDSILVSRGVEALGGGQI